jgi:hypothetical protein
VNQLACRPIWPRIYCVVSPQYVSNISRNHLTAFGRILQRGGYKRETNEALGRFLGHRLKFPECIAALDAAPSGLIPKLTPGQLPEGTVAWRMADLALAELCVR